MWSPANNHTAKDVKWSLNIWFSTQNSTWTNSKLDSLLSGGADLPPMSSCNEKRAWCTIIRVTAGHCSNQWHLALIAINVHAVSFMSDETLVTHPPQPPPPDTVVPKTCQSSQEWSACPSPYWWCSRPPTVRWQWPTAKNSVAIQILSQILNSTTKT